MTSYKYFALYSELKNKIINGEYKAGEKLPSKRTMADKTNSSLITVERAYSMLDDEGYISAKERKGYFVSAIRSFTADLPEKAPVEIRYLEEEKDTAGEAFEYSVWAKTIRRVLSEKGRRLFVKAPGAGCAVLRNALSDYLLRYRGMRAQPEQIIIGSGAEQLYESVVKLLGRELCYGIENPSYAKIEAVYSGMGVSVAHLEMGSEGIVTEALEKTGFDVLHVTPFHSYPSGVTTSISKRYEYLRWAETKGTFIVEDDFDSEFFLPGNPIQSLYSLDINRRVIYINTFSKSLSPSMRMGYMILPDRLMEKYREVFGRLSCSVPVTEQYVLADFIASGNFERHLNRVRRMSLKQEHRDKSL